MITLAGEAATAAVGERLAGLLRPGDFVALHGDLGAGKTSLVRGALMALGLECEAPSPSFTLVQAYDLPEVTLPLWHVDLYRLYNAADTAELGLGDARGYAALLVEWPERLGSALPQDALHLRLDGAGETARRLTWDVPPAWEGRWPPPPPFP